MDLKSLAGFARFARPGLFLSGLSILRHIYQLRASQWKGANEQRRIQLHRARNLVRYAYEKVPYYRRHFDKARFRPSDLRTIDDFSAIPITTKKEIREQRSDFISRDFDPSRLKRSFTSGSTGTPLEVLKDKRAAEISTALKAFAFLACGSRLTDRFASMTRVPDTRWPLLKVLFPSPDSAPTLAALKALDPDVLYIFPPHLARMGGEDLGGIHPRLIFTQGMPVTEQAREVARAEFGTELFDTYGSIEFSRLAFECSEHNGLHTITDWSVVEFLSDGKPARPGEPGEVVVTGLHNYAQPLIRYSLDDIAVPTDETCPCGRAWPMIRSIEGRLVDRLIMPSGRIVTPGVVFEEVYPVLRPRVSCLSEFQLIQLEPARFAFNYIPGKDFDPDAVEVIRANLERGFARYGDRVVVESRPVDVLETGRSGKVQMVVSRVDR